MQDPISISRKGSVRKLIYSAFTLESALTLFPTLVSGAAVSCTQSTLATSDAILNVPPAFVDSASFFVFRFRLLVTWIISYPAPLTSVTIRGHNVLAGPIGGSGGVKINGITQPYEMTGEHGELAFAYTPSNIDFSSCNIIPALPAGLGDQIVYVGGNYSIAGGSSHKITAQIQPIVEINLSDGKN